MPNQQLIEYITQSIAQGASKEQIKTALLSAGWQEADVNEGLLAVFPVSAPKSAVSGKSKALIMTVSMLAVFLLAGGGFAYWYFVYEPKQQITLPQEQALPPQKSTQEEQSQPSATTTESIQNILAKAKNIGRVYYEVKETRDLFGNGENPINDFTEKHWEKYPLARVETEFYGPNTNKGIPFIDIMRDGKVFEYDYAKNVYRELSRPTIPPDEVRFTFLSDFSDFLGSNTKLEVIGSEKVDGKDTTIVQYPSHYPQPSSQKLTYKAWIWNEKGIPLKVDTILEFPDLNVGPQTTEYDYSGFLFRDIPDSMFEVPQDKIVPLNSPISPEDSRDIERTLNVQAMATAIESYTSKQNPRVAPMETDIGCPAGWATDISATTIGCPDLTKGNPPLSTYLQKLPEDSVANTYVYNNQGSDNTFCLGAKPRMSSIVFFCNSVRCTAKDGSFPWTAIDCPEQ